MTCEYTVHTYHLLGGGWDGGDGGVGWRRLLFIACAVRDVLCSVVFNLDRWKNHFEFLAKIKKNEYLINSFRTRLHSSRCC